MVSRRSQLSSARLAREWPHQVAVRATLVAQRHADLLTFCQDLAVAPRQQTVRRDDEGYVIYAFADPEHPARFLAQFEGERFDSRQRGRGARWYEWRQK